MTFNNSMASKLSALTGRQVPRRTNTRDGIKDPAPSPAKWVGDGIDHINIWERGVTELGVALSHSSPLPFTHSIFGKFSCMESFWHYIQSEERDDRLRTMTSKTLRPFAHKLTPTRAVNFRAIIMDSNWQRVKQYGALADAIKESELPFDCYTEDRRTGLRQRPTFFKWFIRGFEEIRKALKEGRDPNFSFLLDKGNSGIYDFVAPTAPVKQATAEKSQPKKQVASLLRKAVQENKAKEAAASEAASETEVNVVDGHAIDVANVAEPQQSEDIKSEEVESQEPSDTQDPVAEPAAELPVIELNN